eukprot:jgi/Tetstr1/427196/TSEL_017384.t1
MGVLAGQVKPASCKVFLGNLDERVTRKTLYELCCLAGPVVELFTPKANAGSRRFAFVHYDDYETAAYAVCLLNGTVRLFGQPLNVNFANDGALSPPPQPAAAVSPTSPASGYATPAASSPVAQQHQQNPQWTYSPTAPSNGEHVPPPQPLPLGATQATWQPGPPGFAGWQPPFQQQTPPLHHPLHQHYHEQQQPGMAFASQGGPEPGAFQGFGAPPPLPAATPPAMPHTPQSPYPPAQPEPFPGHPQGHTPPPPPPDAPMFQPHMPMTMAPQQQAPRPMFRQPAQQQQQQQQQPGQYQYLQQYPGGYPQQQQQMHQAMQPGGYPQPYYPNQQQPYM